MSDANQSAGLATTDQVAEFLGVSVQTLAKMRMEDGDGPEFIKINARTVRYQWPAVHKWVAERTRTSTAA